MAIEQVRRTVVAVDRITKVKSAAELVGKIVKGPVFIGRTIMDQSTGRSFALTAFSVPRFGYGALYSDRTVDEGASSPRKFTGVLLDRKNARAIVVMTDPLTKKVQTATYNTDLSGIEFHFQPIPDNQTPQKQRKAA